jgi:hypothetical protein
VLRFVRRIGDEDGPEGPAHNDAALEAVIAAKEPPSAAGRGRTVG